MTTKHLWKISHHYYCSLINYFSDKTTQEYESWDDFIAEEGDADPAYNLLFRFDWLDADNKDNGIKIDELHLFWIDQRKGIFRSTVVKVTKNNEPEIAEWLEGRFLYLKKLWSPFK